MLIENTLFGVKDKVKKSIDRLKAFEPPEGYYLCFSGGKDSQVIYHLALEAGVKFDAHYNVTGIDHPELVYFIREYYPDVIRHTYEQSMFQMIAKWGLPYRNRRYCCSVLKEHGGEGRVCVTGVRWAESNNRRNRRPFEIVTKKREDKKLFNDNDEDRRMFENCMQKGKRVVNPIVDWSDDEVWEYLNSRNIPHCKLYDEGYDRLGCIGCPLAGNQKEVLERYPKYKENYKRAIKKFFPSYLERCKAKNKKPDFDDVDDLYNWWVGDLEIKRNNGQIDIFDDED